MALKICKWKRRKRKLIFCIKKGGVRDTLFKIFQFYIGTQVIRERIIHSEQTIHDQVIATEITNGMWERKRKTIFCSPPSSLIAEVCVFGERMINIGWCAITARSLQRVCRNNETVRITLRNDSRYKFNFILMFIRMLERVQCEALVYLNSLNICGLPVQVSILWTIKWATQLVTVGSFFCALFLLRESRGKCQFGSEKCNWHSCRVFRKTFLSILNYTQAEFRQRVMWSLIVFSFSGEFFGAVFLAHLPHFVPVCYFFIEKVARCT